MQGFFCNNIISLKLPAVHNSKNIRISLLTTRRVI